LSLKLTGDAVVGIHFTQDTHTDDRGVLSVDRHQDYVLDLVHVTSAGSLVAEFHRLFDTCDNDDYLIDVRVNAIL